MIPFTSSSRRTAPRAGAWIDWYESCVFRHRLAGGGHHEIIARPCSRRLPGALACFATVLGKVRPFLFVGLWAGIVGVPGVCSAQFTGTLDQVSPTPTAYTESIDFRAFGIGDDGDGILGTVATGDVTAALFAVSRKLSSD